MKLWHSFIKELKLAFRGFYIYIEIFMAVLLLAVLLFAVPEHFESKQSEYIYLDLPSAVEEAYLKEIEKMDIDGEAEQVEIKIDDKLITAKLFVSEDREIYIMENKEDVKKLAEKKQKLGAVIKMDSENKLSYEYYLQGYESQRLKNLLRIVHNEDSDTLIAAFEEQEVRPLSTDYEILTDRQNIIPSFLTFNGSLMGLFIIAAYIFLDKQEGVIKAYAVTASSVWQYLMSKVGVLLLTSIVSSFVIVVPIMGTQPNYLVLLVFLLTTGFFASSLGLFIASFYKTMTQAFGAVYLLMMIMILPNFAYFIPSWNPAWMKFFPTYPMLEGFKELLLKDGDMSYVLMTSLVFLLVGVVLFVAANRRYKRTLTV